MKRFSQEFKDSAVAVYEQGGVTYRELALELGVSQASLKKWVSDARQGETALSGEDMEELKRLRKENKRLRMEREILNVAATNF